MSHPSSPGTLARGVLRGLLGASLVLACSAAAAPRPTPQARAAGPLPPLVVAPVHIHGMSYDRARHSLVLTITGPVTISTRVLKAPPRLVVDIPSASLDSANRELTIKDDLVNRVRVSQFKILPPTVRVVIETASATEPLIAVQQTGKRLYITLAPARPGEETPAEGVLPSPGPEPSSFTPPTLPEATPQPPASAAPAPRLPIPTVAPVRPTPAPARPTPTPAAAPVGRPGIQTRLRPGMPIPTPIGRRTSPPAPTPAASARPGGEWQDLFPANSPTPVPRGTARPAPPPTPDPTPTAPAFWSPGPGDEATPVPPPRGTEETGNETWPTIP
jgi:hypothetical protein